MFLCGFQSRFTFACWARAAAGTHNNAAIATPLFMIFMACSLSSRVLRPPPSRQALRRASRAPGPAVPDEQPVLRRDGGRNRLRPDMVSPLFESDGSHRVDGERPFHPARQRAGIELRQVVTARQDGDPCADRGRAIKDESVSAPQAWLDTTRSPAESWTDARGRRSLTIRPASRGHASTRTP